MQRGSLDGCSGQRDGFEICHGGECAGFSDLNLDGFDDGLGLFSGKLEGDAPARGPAAQTQLPLVIEPIDLDDHSVDLIVKRFPLILPIITNRDDLVDIRRLMGMRIDRQAEFVQMPQGVVMAVRDGFGGGRQ